MSEFSAEKRRGYCQKQQAFDEMFLEIWDQDKITIPSTECEPGFLYWGMGRAIGDVAICSGVNESGQMQFEGLRSKLGFDYLGQEIHHDDDSSSGTWKPFFKYDKTPEFRSSEEKMRWILMKNIEILQIRIDWLEVMPKSLKIAPSYNIFLEQDIQQLSGLLKTQNNGFNKRPAHTPC